MKAIKLFTIMSLLVIFSPVIGIGQSGGVFQISKSVIAGGGGNSTGGIFNLDGTTGQCVAGSTSTGGIFTLAGGFWGGGSVVGTPTPTPTATPTSTPTASPTTTPTATPTATPTPGGGFEGDVSPRTTGNGIVLSTDVIQMRRFATGLDTPDPLFNEQQRADSAPRTTLGDGILNSADVIQARRYAAGLEPITDAGGPASPSLVPNSQTIEGLYEYFSRREVNVGDLVSENAATVAIPVEIVALGDEMAIGFTLEYDPAMLGDPQVFLADGAPSDAVLTVNYGEKGRLGILIDAAEPFSPSDESSNFVTVRFTIFKRGETSIRVTDDLASKGISNKDGDLLVTRWRDSLFRID